MSTILKALRRLEEEKARDMSSRPLREEIASSPREQPRRRGVPWLPLIAMLIGGGLGASAWWVWPYERGGEPVRDVAAETRAPGTPSAPPLTPPTVAAAPVLQMPPEPEQIEPFDAGGPPEDAFASAVAVVERPQPVPRIEPPPAVPAPKPERVIADPPRVATVSPAVIARRPKPAASEPAVAAERARPERAPKPAPVAAAPEPEATPAPARASEPPAPAREEPREPAPARVTTASVPAAGTTRPGAPDAGGVRVKRTQWHPDAKRRSADVELAGKSESVKEGDVVGEYIVSEIRPSGVVLTRDGETIVQKIGEP